MSLAISSVDMRWTANFATVVGYFWVRIGRLEGSIGFALSVVLAVGLFAVGLTRCSNLSVLIDDHHRVFVSFKQHTNPVCDGSDFA